MASTDADLYRMGRGSNAKMEPRVPKDIPTFDKNGEQYVKEGTGGVSTDSKQPKTSNVWKLDSGYAYDDLLHVYNDHGTHYLWEPKSEMKLADFQAALLTTHASWTKVTDGKGNPVKA